jgi:hypothetical protein
LEPVAQLVSLIEVETRQVQDEEDHRQEYAPQIRSAEMRFSRQTKWLQSRDQIPQADGGQRFVDEFIYHHHEFKRHGIQQHVLH